ncbi:hypothetical protein, partial [Streptomyces yangpuensis]|uniref:hypothetical protein n=1 Tax=Streptomyces yangpuensis TaxID=1648182 RepID=UPI001F3AED9D
RNVPAEVNNADPCARAGQSSVKKRFLPDVNARGSALDHAELRALERVEAAGGARVLLEGDRVLDPGLVQDKVRAGFDPRSQG